MGAFAICITAYNRRDTTIECLKSVYDLQLPPKSTLTVYLVDDGSSDGTSDAVARCFPQVRILKGNGSLYWGGGMRLAFGEAMKDEPDFYFWLNDDVKLYSDALIRLVASYLELVTEDGDPAIIVGACQDPAAECTTYSGRRRSSWNPLRFTLVEPRSDVSVACDTMNGNVVLIPAAVTGRIGNIEPRFVHQMGDLDYGLRAHHAGIPIWLAPGYAATCALNSRSIEWKSGELTLSERLKVVNTPLGLPLLPWLTFAWRHGRALGVIAALLGYREMFIPRSRSTNVRPI